MVAYRDPPVTMATLPTNVGNADAGDTLTSTAADDDDILIYAIMYSIE